MRQMSKFNKGVKFLYATNHYAIVHYDDYHESKTFKECDELIKYMKKRRNRKNILCIEWKDALFQ